ncbi:hypothetical protein OXX79_005796 [Metschnikowia pulcherrima]
MSRSDSAKAWLYSWGGNPTPASDNVAKSAETPREGHKASESAAKTDFENAEFPADNCVTDSAESQKRELISKPPSQDKPTTRALTGQSRETSPRRVVCKSPQKHTNTLKHKSSTTSLGSYAASTWLGWSAKTARSNSLPEEDHGAAEDLEQKQSAGLDGPNTIEESVGESDHVDTSNADSRKPLSSPSVSSQRQSSPTNSTAEDADSKLSQESDAGVKDRKPMWNFWTLAEDPAKKDVPMHTRVTNTILKSTPSLPSRKELQGRPDSSTEVTADSGSNPLGGSKSDDAVLYKPHHGAKEFKEINIHKSENLAKNSLVPDWNTCLKAQGHASNSTTASNLHSTGFRSALSLRNWRDYLSHISAKLGFLSQLDDTSSEDSASTANATTGPHMEALHFSNERTYKLYGKSLSRLPSHKRACLPNVNKIYTVANSTSKRQKLQDEHTASVLVDSGDGEALRINAGQSADVHTKKVGPLQKVNRILIIGVHGFFPTRMIRPIIGAPKGTSSKFANEAEKSVIRYLVENNMMNENEAHDISIQKIALEKEGKIFDRVDFFLQILTKWAEELNEADFIMIAAHSQGCVVSIILLARLIRRGILKNASQKRIGILAMAGVNNGPFYGIDKSLFMKAYSAIEHDSMIELFELTKFDSPQSLAYKDAIQTIVGVNVKLCLVGSINDQLVPLYSALASHVFHPNIYRACYIDSASKTPDFIKALISLCCHLQNNGYFDNNVIKEISPVLAGPLTGGGHSRIYNDGKVYDLGIKFMLDTDDIVIPKSAVITDYSEENVEANLPITNKVHVKEYNVGKIGTNPFILPWCLRGLIFNIQKNWRPVTPEITVQNGELQKSAEEEIKALYGLFDQWRPETKALKDLKFRLSGIRISKL